jgi:hypothetical protein
MNQTTNKIVKAFLVGRPIKVGNSQSTGRAMYLFGNKIAEWREDGLWITNCGWQTVTTKERLNGIGMYLNFWIAQRKGSWYITGNELGGETYWSGDWVKVHNDLPDSIDFDTKSQDIIIEKYWVPNGHRGHYDVRNSVLYQSDTGMWEDSPYNSLEAKENIKECVDLLKKHGIKSKTTTCETSNVFCINHFVVVSEYDYERAMDIINSYK